MTTDNHAPSKRAASLAALRHLIWGAGLATSLAASLPAWAVNLANPSLTSPVANNAVPFGWSIQAGSPDINDINSPVGFPAGPAIGFAVTPSPSPDGGTWVGLGTDDSFGFTERFGQFVSGFTVGTDYSVSWYAANFGVTGAAVGGAFDSPGSVEFFLNGNSVGMGEVLPLQTGWVLQSLSFTATAATQQLAFGAVLGPTAYLAIDGIAVTVVPEPATTALMLAGLVGVVASTRRFRKAQFLN